ncbi:T9SS type A sorting domain-containing protein [Flavobacterium sp.]|uniref:T9SS type A sorting domain-containing protein n=1 Tax=Flavobacterium sp. TaxID=239 RepID=UPI00333E59AB
MKKILLFTLILFGMSATAQNHTTGVINLTTGYTVKFDTNSTTVTMTLVGPSDKWLGLGFGMTSMFTSGDGVIASGASATLTDRNFTGSGSTPNSDATQNWTTTSNAVVGTVRTIVATRALSTGDTSGSDFTFTNSTASINLIWALGSSLTLAQHQSRGSGVSGTFALSTDSFAMAGFKLYPNPAVEIFAIELPNNIENISVKIFDVMGKDVIEKEISKLENKINTSALSAGNYLVKVFVDDKSYTTTLIIQ